jgi:hypothetical protein
MDGVILMVQNATMYASSSVDCLAYANHSHCSRLVLVIQVPRISIPYSIHWDIVQQLKVSRSHYLSWPLTRS